MPISRHNCGEFGIIFNSKMRKTIIPNRQVHRVQFARDVAGAL